MKQFFFVMALLWALNGFSQSQYEVIKEGNTKILKGILTRDLIAHDSSFSWYRRNTAGYTPNAAVVNTLREKGPNLEFLFFGGTWCGDTKNILPKFFAVLDAARIPGTHVTLIGVDRAVKSIGHLPEAMGITNVPTIIVLEQGREVGRVVEYGKSGLWDRELAAVVETAK